MYLSPAWLLRPQEWGWQVVSQSSAQATIAERIADAAYSSNIYAQHIVVPMQGPHGSFSRRLRLFAWLALHEEQLRRQLGLGPLNPPPPPPYQIRSINLVGAAGDSEELSDPHLN